MSKILRDYQNSAVASVFDWFGSGKDGHPLVVAPVGAGKSLIIAELIRQIHQQAARTRIVVATHVKELLEQNAAELVGQYPTADFGFYCAGLGQKRLHNDITFVSIQSIHNKVHQFNRPPQVNIVDEAHLISHNDQTTYRKFIDACMAANPNCKVVGLTGSPFRSDSGRLDEGDGALFDGVAYEIDIAWMIEQGYLVRPATPRTAFKMDVTGVGIRNGDYIAGQLEKAVDVDAVTQACVADIVAKGAGRKRWLVFTAGVQHAEHVRDALRAMGISAEVVIGDMPKDERDEVLKRHKAGQFTALVNVAVLTTGYNDPAIDLLAIMRPMRSPVLYTQCVGRGIRTNYAAGMPLETAQQRLEAIAASDKPDVLLLDFGGVVEALGPIDALEIRGKPAKKNDGEVGEAVTKRCPSCGTLCMAAQRYCFSCSYAFISDKLVASASTAAVLTADAPEEEYMVMAATYTKHYKAGDAARALDGLPTNSPPTMRVTYTTMAGSFSEYVCFEHEGYARQRAIKWHFDRMVGGLCPDTVDEALKLKYPEPSVVVVKKEGKYTRVVRCTVANRAHDAVDEVAVDGGLMAGNSHKTLTDAEFESFF